MSPKEASIIAFALRNVLSNWDDDIEETLEGIAIEKDLEFLVGKYESLSKTFAGRES